MTTATATGCGAPEASPAVISSAVRQAVRHVASRSAGQPAGREQLVLLRAAPQWRGDPTISVETPQGPVIAHVRGCPTVLAVLDALGEDRDPGAYLVVLTPCEDRDLGASILALALKHEVLPIDRWDLVLEAFGARRLDPRLLGNEYRWLAEALLDAQPGGGWRRASGLVLPAEIALSRLAALRLGQVNEDDQVDAAALLDWSRDETRVARFLSLRQEERDGLAAWLVKSAGPVAEVVFSLLNEGQIIDAIAFGLVVAEIYGDATDPASTVMLARGRAEQRFFGGRSPDPAGLRAFAEAAESLTLRWNDNGHAADARAMCDRAEQILSELGAADLAAGSSILASGLEAKISALADAITLVLPEPRPADLPAVEAALTALTGHRRGAGAASEAGEAAVRLLRWIVGGEPAPATIAAGVSGQVRSWAWVDRAVAVIASPDTAGTPRARAAYAALHAAVRRRRAALDEAFAVRLAAWSPAAGTTDDLLLMENVLDRVARPLTTLAAPLLIVVDGMSASVACSLAEGIAAMRIWEEIGRHESGREGALAVLPTATTFCRTSLFCGQLRAGGRAEERAGFAAFWRGRKTALFHKADLPAGPGARLSAAVQEALADAGTVVGVVLNTIDEALRDGKEGSAPTWQLADVTYLYELLAAAAGAGRPVVLTSDHGHVPDRGDGVLTIGAESARYRQGTPGEGEVLIAGPRVLTPGAAAVLPWDERIRYAARKAGYHGGAALAEVVAPMLVFVPTGSAIPKGWVTYPTPSLHEPPWWNSDSAAPAGTGPGSARPAVPTTSRKPAKRPPAGTGTLFTDADLRGAVPPAADSLGARVTGSAVYAVQRAFVRKAPEDGQVAAVIDALARAGGKIPVATLAGFAGQPAFRMGGYLAQLGRLLNVDGYPVIVIADEGRTAELNVALLREQFLGGS